MPTLPGDKDPLTQPGGWSGVLSVRKTAIQPQEGASLMDSVFAAGEEALLASPVSSIARMDELRSAKQSGRQIGADDARAQIESRGLKGHLTIPEQGVTQDYLDILINRKEEELRRGELIASAPQGFGAGSARFGASFVASMFDPINVASAFVPVVGQARYLKWLGAAKGIAGRTAVRAGVGATEGLAGAALVEPLIAMAKDEEQADYDMADSLANIAFGTVFGGGLHVVGGAGGDLYRRVTGATNPWDLPELKAGRESHAAVYDDIQSQLIAAGRGADEAAANASLVASAFRSMSDVTGRGVDDLYAEFGPRISFARDVDDIGQPSGLRVANQLTDAIVEGRRYGQAAYHGSPHDFDKFSLDKIGTGEGAQAYGWGLYFAENPAVAGQYKRDIAGVDKLYNGRPFDPNDPSHIAAFLSKKEIAHFLKTGAIDTADVAGLNRGAIADALNANPATISTVEKGRLYQVDIADEAVAKMLDWDKPLSEQPESVRRAIAEQVEFASRSIGNAPGKPELFDVTAKLPGQGWASIGTYTKEAADKIMADKLAAVDKIPLTGRYFYKIMSDRLGGDAAASKALRELGIPGLRYLDQGSRDAKTGTRNIVVFDDSIVKITHKDGSPVTAAERKEFLQQRGQDKRGSIDLAKGRRIDITLFQKADRSTFVHETGHLFLEVLDSLGSKADAPEALKADLAKARDWMGLKDGEAIGEKHHEQFARGFEAYLREGKAPTPKLKKVFERFRDWLVGIYKDIRALDVTLSDDVRGVYDRLIAGYDAAKKAELAGPAKREAALKAAIAQTVRGKRVNGAEPIINGDADAAKRAAQNEVDALAEPLPEPLKIEDDDTGIEAAREYLGDVEAVIKASGDEELIAELDDIGEIVEAATLRGRIAKKLAPCIGTTDG